MMWPLKNDENMKGSRLSRFASLGGLFSDAAQATSGRSKLPSYGSRFSLRWVACCRIDRRVRFNLQKMEAQDHKEETRGV
jgi:hypothetical protein